MRYLKISQSKTALVAFAKDPLRVDVKTRLSNVLNKDERVFVYRCLLEDCLEELSTIDNGVLFLACHPDKNSSFFTDLSIVSTAGIELMNQSGTNLGERMANCFKQLLGSFDRVIIFGTDIPKLPTSEIDSSLLADKDWDVLIGASPDGGYYSIGLQTPTYRPIFNDVTWSSKSTFTKTIENCKELKLRVLNLPTRNDIDTVEDLIEFDELNGTGSPKLKQALEKLNFNDLKASLKK